MKESRSVNRTQLIGMIASLRGELCNVIQNYEHRNKPTGSEKELKEAIEEAKRMIDETGFNLSKSDEVDGGFDKTWINHERMSRK